MVNTSKLDINAVSWVNFLALLAFVVIQPLAGALSDRIGRRPLLLFFGIAGTLLTVPLLTLLAGTRTPAMAFLIMMGSLVIVTGYTSINAIVKAELFPTNVRAMGVGLPYALTVAIFGGTAEYIALWLKQAGHESVFFWYVAGCILVSLIVYATMRETTRESALDG
jgi:MHS family alpha-ketoglutarate permease-like MFS transporter